MATSTKIRPAADPIEAAKAEVQRLHRAELDLSEQLLTERATLPTLEAQDGADALEAHLAGTAGTGSRVASLQAKLSTLTAAIDQARTRRRAAIPEVWRAQAAPLREQAATLRREADEREPRTRELLAALLDHEGVEYVPAPPTKLGDQVLHTDPNGVQVRRGWDLTGAAPGPLPDRSPPPAASVVVRVLPRTDYLRHQAAGFEHEADALEAREVQDRGAIRGSTAAELLAQIRAWDPMKLAVPLHVAAAWAMVAEAKQRARIERIPSTATAFGHAEVALYLIWVGDAIDQKASRASVPALDE